MIRARVLFFFVYMLMKRKKSTIITSRSYKYSLSKIVPSHKPLSGFLLSRFNVVLSTRNVQRVLCNDRAQDKREILKIKGKRQCTLVKSLDQLIQKEKSSHNNMFQNLLFDYIYFCWWHLIEFTSYYVFYCNKSQGFSDSFTHDKNKKEEEDEEKIQNKTIIVLFLLFQFCFIWIPYY